MHPFRWKSAATGAGVVLTIVIAIVATTPAGEAGKPAPVRHVVHIQGMLFRPAKLEISPGDTVEWINDDVFLHAVKSLDPQNPWQSKDLPPHAVWAKHFDAGGSYVCPYHPTMTGEITVSLPQKQPGSR